MVEQKACMRVCRHLGSCAVVGASSMHASVHEWGERARLHVEALALGHGFAEVLVAAEDGVLRVAHTPRRHRPVHSQTVHCLDGSHQLCVYAIWTPAHCERLPYKEVLAECLKSSHQQYVHPSGHRNIGERLPYERPRVPASSMFSYWRRSMAFLQRDVSDHHQDRMIDPLL